MEKKRDTRKTTTKTSKKTKSKKKKGGGLIIILLVILLLVAAVASAFFIMKNKKEQKELELTIPAEFINEQTQKELNEQAKEYGYKVRTNDDGSVTYTMSASQHKKVLEEMAKSITQSINEMIGSESYPNFTGIETNDNFTEFTVTTKSAELDIVESFSVMAFYIYGGLYNVFAGEEIDDVSVTFVNADSGQVIETMNSSDMEQKENETQETLSQQDETVYTLGQPWVVDGQWSLTVNGISVADQRNEFDERNPAQVFIIDYTYENIGYVDESGMMNGLFIDLSSSQIIDSTGITAARLNHQPCWWSELGPLQGHVAFPPKGGLTNLVHLVTGGRLKAAFFYLLRLFPF